MSLIIIERNGGGGTWRNDFPGCRPYGHTLVVSNATFPRDPPRSSRRLKMSYRLTAVCLSAGGHHGSVASELAVGNREKATESEREREREDPERAECGLDTLHPVLSNTFDGSDLVRAL